jgi:hypothetical protein
MNQVRGFNRPEQVLWRLPGRIGEWKAIGTAQVGARAGVIDLVAFRHSGIGPSQ